MPERPTLTPAGRAYAEAEADASITARVALLGYDGEWPEQHVSTAVNLMNDRARTEGKRPQPFTDADGVELVTADGRLTLAGAARLLGEEI